MKNDYLPMNRNDMSIRGWKQCDFVYVSGDAYVDQIGRASCRERV